MNGFTQLSEQAMKEFIEALENPLPLSDELVAAFQKYREQEDNWFMNKQED